MKSFFSIPLLILAFAFLGCDEVKKITQQDVFAPINVEFVIPRTDSSYVVSIDSLDASSNTDFMNNRSKIDDLEIDLIQYQVSSLHPDVADTLVDGKLEVKNPGTGLYQTLCTFTNKRMVKSLLETPTFDPNVANLLVASVRNSPYRSVIRYQAFANKKPVEMTIVFTVRLKLKIKV